MADTTLTNLTNVADTGSIADTDEMYAVVGNQSHAITFPKLSEYLNGRGAQFNVRDFGAIGNGLADDRFAIQAAIDAAAANGGGIVHIPAGIYSLGSPLTPKDGVSIRGVRPTPAFTQLCPDLGIDVNNGSWLRAQIPGQVNGIVFNTNANPQNDQPLSNVEICELGFVGFATAIKGGAYNHLSFGLGRLEDLVFLGKENGQVYTRHAVDIENFQHLQVNHLKAFNCLEPFNFRANHTHCSPGNSVFIDLYAYMDTMSGNYAIRLQSTDGSLQLNTITMIRPQVNWFTNPAAHKSNILIEGIGSGQVTQCHLIDTNTEGGNGAHITLINAMNCRLDIASTVIHAGSATVVLRQSGCMIYSQTPFTTVDCDGTSSSLSQVNGIIHSITSSAVPPGIRTENGHSPREFFTGLGRDGMGLRLKAGENLITQENFQITQQISNFSGSSPTITLTPDKCGTVYVSLTSSRNGRIYLPIIYANRQGLEFTIVKKDSLPGSIIITARQGHSINGHTELKLSNPWDQATLRAADDQSTWVVISTTGTLI